jgi:NitT/TauT family transport system ATP-binding protein
MLQATHEKRLERGVAQTALELDFPGEVAARQLETIVNWGRYTELLAYDDTHDVFYLEPAGAVPRLSRNSGTAAAES